MTGQICRYDWNPVKEREPAYMFKVTPVLIYALSSLVATNSYVP